ncbi:hypothetical protein AVEN_1492-1 [Araneus ventricosus]|uniref:Uncharacterized protein n=1 Tax=Araneus ventricosus TaxID=182803 RepID=A0A4Y2M2E8_ARAVE|nr:hypothetical protein AVEN_1492-1 [Araneus ventricosus]
MELKDKRTLTVLFLRSEVTECERCLSISNILDTAPRLSEPDLGRWGSTRILLCAGGVLWVASGDVGLTTVDLDREPPEGIILDLERNEIMKI